MIIQKTLESLFCASLLFTVLPAVGLAEEAEPSPHVRALIFSSGKPNKSSMKLEHRLKERFSSSVSVSLLDASMQGKLQRHYAVGRLPSVVITDKSGLMLDKLEGEEEITDCVPRIRLLLSIRTREQSTPFNTIQILMSIIGALAVLAVQFRYYRFCMRALSARNGRSQEGCYKPG